MAFGRPSKKFDKNKKKPERGNNLFKRKKFCRFTVGHVEYIDYKDGDFLLKLCNEQGKLLPRRLTGTSLKYQRKVAQAVKKARHLALMPYVADMLK